MATWTQNQSLGSETTLKGWHATYDDSRYIYYLWPDGGVPHVWQYDTQLDSVTQISNSSSFASGYEIKNGLDTGRNGNVRPGPIYFNSGLYVAVLDSATNFDAKVYKYDGSGTSWTSVLDLTTSWISTSTRTPNLLSSGSQLILSVIGSDSGPTRDIQVRYTSDGSSWSTGTFAETTTPGFAASTWSQLSFGFNENRQPVLLDFQELGITKDFDRIMQWDGVSGFSEIAWYEIDGGATGDSWVADYDLRDKMHWYTPSNEEYEDAATPSGSSTAPANTDVAPIHMLGFNSVSNVKAAGRFDPVDQKVNFYLMDDSYVWDSGEEIDAAVGTSILTAVRFTATGETYVFVRESNNKYIYQRDATLTYGSVYGLQHSASGLPGSII